MSFLDTAEQPDYEEADTTISYTLSFNDGQDAVQLLVSHPASSSELDFELTDPALITALHAACQAVVDDYFRSENEQQEWVHLHKNDAHSEEWL